MILKWIKINLDMFEDEKIKLIMSKDNGIITAHIWVRLLLLAGKINNNGLIYLSKNTPYTVEMFETLFNIEKIEIEKSLETLMEYKLISRGKDKKIKIVNWNKHQDVYSIEKNTEQSRERMRKKRARDKVLEKERLRNSYVNVTSKNKEKEEDIDIEKEEDFYESMEKLHGKHYVKMAIAKAKEAKKLNIFYVRGILKNWQRDGYPKDLFGGDVDDREGQGEFMLQTSYRHNFKESGENTSIFREKLI